MPSRSSDGSPCPDATRDILSNALGSDVNPHSHTISTAELTVSLPAAALSSNPSPSTFTSQLSTFGLSSEVLSSSPVRGSWLYNVPITTPNTSIPFSSPVSIATVPISQFRGFSPSSNCYLTQPFVSNIPPTTPTAFYIFQQSSRPPPPMISLPLSTQSQAPIQQSSNQLQNALPPVSFIPGSGVRLPCQGFAYPPSSGIDLNTRHTRFGTFSSLSGSSVSTTLSSILSQASALLPRIPLPPASYHSLTPVTSVPATSTGSSVRTFSSLPSPLLPAVPLQGENGSHLVSGGVLTLNCTSDIQKMPLAITMATFPTKTATATLNSSPASLSVLSGKLPIPPLTSQTTISPTTTLQMSPFHLRKSYFPQASSALANACLSINRPVRSHENPWINNLSKRRFSTSPTPAISGLSTQVTSHSASVTASSEPKSMFLPESEPKLEESQKSVSQSLQSTGACPSNLKEIVSINPIFKHEPRKRKIPHQATKPTSQAILDSSAPRFGEKKSIPQIDCDLSISKFSKSTLGSCEKEANSCKQDVFILSADTTTPKCDSVFVDSSLIQSKSSYVPTLDSILSLTEVQGLTPPTDYIQAAKSNHPSSAAGPHSSLASHSNLFCSSLPSTALVTRKYDRPGDHSDPGQSQAQIYQDQLQSQRQDHQQPHFVQSQGILYSVNSPLQLYPRDCSVQMSSTPPANLLLYSHLENSLVNSSPCPKLDRFTTKPSVTCLQTTLRNTPNPQKMLSTPIMLSHSSATPALDSVGCINGMTDVPFNSQLLSSNMQMIKMSKSPPMTLNSKSYTEQDESSRSLDQTSEAAKLLDPKHIIEAGAKATHTRITLFAPGPITPRPISTNFHDDPAEEALWRSGFFGRHTPQQLIYTLVYLFGKLLGLRSGYHLRQLRYGTDGQLRLVIIKKQPRLNGSVSSISSSIVSLVPPANLDIASIRLVYTPDVDNLVANTNSNGATNSHFESNKFLASSEGSGEFADGYALGDTSSVNSLSGAGDKGEAATSVLASTLVSSGLQKLPWIPGGYLLEHYEAYNHERCVVCLHAFYACKRQNLMALRTDCYFLAWQTSTPSLLGLTTASKTSTLVPVSNTVSSTPNHPTIPSVWFRHRPIGHNYLSTIIHTIDAALHTANLAGTCGLSSRPSPVPNVSIRAKAPVASLLLESSAASGKKYTDEKYCQETLSSKRQSDSAFTLPTLQNLEQESRTHPSCLDYWPELTERARRSVWQCADCKTCSVCFDHNSTALIIICDACDKGFHSSCHVPLVLEPVDHNLPWVCSACHAEGYRVALTASEVTHDDTPGDQEPLKSSNTSSLSSHKQDIKGTEEPDQKNLCVADSSRSQVDDVEAILCMHGRTDIGAREAMKRKSDCPQSSSLASNSLKRSKAAGSPSSTLASSIESPNSCKVLWSPDKMSLDDKSVDNGPEALCRNEEKENHALLSLIDNSAKVNASTIPELVTIPSSQLSPNPLRQRSITSTVVPGMNPNEYPANDKGKTDSREVDSTLVSDTIINSDNKSSPLGLGKKQNREQMCYPRTPILLNKSPNIGLPFEESFTKLTSSHGVQSSDKFALTKLASDNSHGNEYDRSDYLQCSGLQPSATSIRITASSTNCTATATTVSSSTTVTTTVSSDDFGCSLVSTDIPSLPAASIVSMASSTLGFDSTQEETTVRLWSVDQVHSWLLHQGFTREAEAFQQQEIDGACLLLMKRMDVLTELGIKLGPAVKIYERIKRLQSISGLGAIH